MQLMPALESFWLSFPMDANLPFGFGITAYSEEDVYLLLAECGVDEWYSSARKIVVRVGVRIQDLDQRNVVPNIGPLQFRGVWYPCMNIGFGTPKASHYKSFRHAS
jgi:hypothetical protein